MLLIDSICWKECLNFSHALHLLVYYIITLPPEVVLIEISFIFFKEKKKADHNLFLFQYRIIFDFKYMEGLLYLKVSFMLRIQCI